MHIAIYFIAGSLFLMMGLVLLVRKLNSSAMEEISMRYPEHSRIEPTITPDAELYFYTTAFSSFSIRPSFSSLRVIA